MSTNHTEHYNLSQWEPGDKVLHTDFNADNATIDKTLSELAATTTWNNQMIQYMGNCSISILSYTGTGTSGSNGPTVVNFGERPRFFIIHGAQVLIFCAGVLRGTAIHPGDDGKTAVIETINFTWNEAEKTYSFYSSSARNQANLEHTTYEIIRFSRKQ